MKSGFIALGLMLILAGCNPDPNVMQGDRGSIYYTTDGGESWKGTDNVREMQIIVSASFPTAKVGYAISASELVRIAVK
jgi:photosystem II stability/assembly factor-like uncharacterized protein